MSQTLKTLLAPYSAEGFSDVWRLALNAVANLNLYNNTPHYWHRVVRSHHELHPLIHRIVHDYEVRPVDWQRMLLEWPHVSKADPMQIAYSRSEEKGRDFLDNADKSQTRTPIGKYIARHYPHIPDHIRRDMCALYAAPAYELWHTMEQIICGIELGPQSCMRSSYGSIPFKSSDNDMLVSWYNGDRGTKVRWSRHPYYVYKPEYGWGMAVQIDKGKPDVVISRALVWQDPNHAHRKGFVRSYVARDNDWSESDHTLEAWLKEQGYAKWGQWPCGAKLAKVPHPTDGGDMLPYIDGGIQRVSNEGEYYAINEDGDIACTNTDGTVDGRGSIGDCEACGDTVYEDDDDHVYAGRHEDTLICGCCRDNHYTWVIGASRTRSYGTTEYYVHDNNAIEVDGQDYDEDNLPAEIVQRADGEYAHRDNVVLCKTDDEYYDPDDSDIVEIDGEYYRTDDADVVECADNEYRLKEDCWQCDHSGDWYSDDEASVDLPEGTYHPDSLRDLADNA